MAASQQGLQPRSCNTHFCFSLAEHFDGESVAVFKTLIDWRKCHWLIWNHFDSQKHSHTIHQTSDTGSNYFGCSSKNQPSGSWLFFISLKVFLFPSSQSIIYYLVHSSKLSTWLKDASIQETLQSYTKWHHIERDPQVFSVKIDEDYVHCLQGVTRASFCNVYLEWIQYCAGKIETVRRSHFITLSSKINIIMYNIHFQIIFQGII